MGREYDLACFTNAFPVLNQHIVYDFEPCDNDQILQVTAFSYTVVFIWFPLLKVWPSATYFENLLCSGFFDLSVSLWVDI